MAANEKGDPDMYFKKDVFPTGKAIHGTVPIIRI